MKKRTAEDDLAKLIGECASDPLNFVMRAFPWGEKGTELEKFDGPDIWQKEVLNGIKEDLAKGLPIQIATASGHGVGKSSLVSWLILWAMATREYTRGVVTANTESQLRTKTWPELAKWHRLFIARHWFDMTATSIRSVNPQEEQGWRIDAIPWSAQNTESFAGLHNQGKRILVIFDEASAVDDVIWETISGALTDVGTEIIWAVFGNPTRNTGRFRECFGRFAHRWRTWRVDSRTVKITNKQAIDQWLVDYGEDSDYVRVRVKGEFPRAGSMQFIPGDLVEAARMRQPEAKLYDPLVMGVDVARFGSDQSVIVLRRGRDAKSVSWVCLRGANTMELAARIVDMAAVYRPDAIFVDEGGVGGGVVDRLNMLKQPVVGVQFGGKADRAMTGSDGMIGYANKRAEMWGNMKDWLRGGMIPDDPDLAAELVSVEYGYAIRDGRDAILLEKKSDMKKRGLASPDLADALCFEAGTMISTPVGLRPIQEITIGDEVNTPFGVTKVGELWVSETESMTEVKFSDGKRLSGKGEHKIFTLRSGQTRLDALSLTDVILTENQWRIKWKFLQVLSTLGSDIQFKPLVDIIRAETNVTGLAFFTVMCGRIFMEKYQKTTIFTTKMKTGLTTTFQIWSRFIAPRTRNFICTNGMSGGCSSLLQNMPFNVQQNGTHLPKELNGIESTRSPNGRTQLPKPRNVKYAIKTMKLTWAILNIVARLVLKKLGINAILRKLKSAFGAVKNLLGTAIAKQNVVPVSVVTRNVPTTLVYNLTLEKHNAYYANGVLVYNCLTFAYPVNASDHRGSYEQRGGSHQIAYDPLAISYVNRDLGYNTGGHQVGYDPLSLNYLKRN